MKIIISLFTRSNKYIPFIKNPFSLISIVSILFSNFAFADTHIVFDSKPEQQLKQVLSQLNLSDEQKAKLSSFLQSVEPQFVKNLAESNENTHALEQLVGENYDATTVAQLADAQGKIVADTIILRMQVRHQIYALLTPMQRLKVKEIQLEKN